MVALEALEAERIQEARLVVARLQLKRFAELSERSIDLILRQQDPPERAQGCGVFRAKRHRFFRYHERLDEAVEFDVASDQLVVRVAVRVCRKGGL